MVSCRYLRVRHISAEGRLRGLPIAVTLGGLRLQAVQERDGALGVSGGSEDRTLVALQNFKPVRDVVRVIFSRLRRDAEVGGQERAAKFGNKLLGGIAFVAPTLASKLAIEPLLVASPVRRLVRQGGVVAFGVLEALERRQLHEVLGDVVVGTTAAMPDVGARVAEECFGKSDPLHGIEHRRSGC